MKKKIKSEVLHEGISLVPNMTYRQVRSWFDASYQDLKMSLLIPKAAEGHRKLPLIVFLCGGAFYDMDWNVWIPQLTKLAWRGFVIASVQYRTSNLVEFPGQLTDVKAAIRFLRARADRYSIDPDRVFLMGESAGASCATLCSVTDGNPSLEEGDFLNYSSRVQGVVDLYGMEDLRQFESGMDQVWKSEDPVNRAILHFQGKLEQASAICHVTEKTPPTILFHGDADCVVPMSQSEGYYRRLQEAGVRSDFYVVEGAQHGDDRFYQESIFDLIAAFLEEIV